MNGNVIELRWISKMQSLGIHINKVGHYYDSKGIDAVVYKDSNLFNIQCKQHVCSFSYNGWAKANADIDKYRNNNVHHIIIIEPDKYFNEDLERLLKHVEDVNAIWLREHIIVESQFLTLYK